MTYDEFIQNIIETRGQWAVPDSEIYEIHHILPRCLGGLPNKIHDHIIKHPNLIWLTPEEHYIAHKLLVEKYPNNNKLIYAFWRLSNGIETSAEDYALARKLFVEAKRNCTQSAEVNKRRSETMKSHKLIWYTNGQQEIRASSCPEGFYPGRCDSLKENNSKKCKARNLHLYGKLNGMYGKHHTEESNKKRSAWTSARHWYNNGIIEVFETVCPDGFKPGRLKRG